MPLLNFETTTFPSAFTFVGGSFVFDEDRQDGTSGNIFQEFGPLHPVASNMLIQSDQATHVHLQFNVTGWMVSRIAGTWTAQVFLEKQGAGEAVPLPVGTTPHLPSGNIALDVNIPTLTEGIYRVSVMLTFFETNWNLKLPLAASSDIGLLTVYDVS